jgi:hypothetical protein
MSEIPIGIFVGILAVAVIWRVLGDTYLFMDLWRFITSKHYRRKLWEARKEEE